MTRVVTHDFTFELKNLIGNLSDEAFFEFCQVNDHLRIEKDAKGNVIIMPPVGSESGYYEVEAVAELRDWNKNRAPQPGVTFSSSTGFKLPNGATRSPDASWLSMEKWRALSEEQRERFAPVCPDFLIEIRSKTDILRELKDKMTEWIENGARLAWLIDPIDRQAYIYRADGSIQIIKDFNAKLSGEGVLPGFELDLTVFELPE